ncbi:MAG: hypothetical protein RR214_07105 [Synergistaceae bacterium]
MSPLNKEDIALIDAKAKFADAMRAADPKNFVRRKPIPTVAAALLSGVALTAVGSKLIRNFSPAAMLLSSIIKKLGTKKES